MKHNMTVQVLSYTGKPFMGPPATEGGEPVPVQLKDLLIDACLNADPQEYGTGDKKIQVYKLLDKIYRADPTVDLSSEEVTLLKNLAGKRCTVAAVGAIFELLENPTAKPYPVENIAPPQAAAQE